MGKIATEGPPGPLESAGGEGGAGGEAGWVAVGHHPAFCGFSRSPLEKVPLHPVSKQPPPAAGGEASINDTLGTPC